MDLHLDLFLTKRIKDKKTGGNTVYKPLLGHPSSGKFLRIFQRSFVPLMVRAETRNSSYTRNVVAHFKMTLENFEIADDYIGLNYEDKYLDLHNCYDLEGFQYSTEKQVFLLKFRKGKHGNSESPESFELLFKNVSFLKIGERDAEMDAPDETCLEFIGFLPFESREIMDGFLTNMPKSPTDEMIINTYTGQAIKLQSASAEFIPLDK